MPHFMHGRFPLVELVHFAARHGGEEDVTAILDVGGGRAGGGGAGACFIAVTERSGMVGGGDARGHSGGSGELAEAEEEGGRIEARAGGGEVGLEVDV